MYIPRSSMVMHGTYFSSRVNNMGDFFFHNNFYSTIGTLDGVGGIYILVPYGIRVDTSP